MSARLFLALFFSIALVGGALWVRLENNSRVDYKLTLVESGALSDSGLESYFLGENSGAEVMPDTTASSATDELGRQILADYVSLATSGQASEETIGALAEKYVATIPTLARAETVKASELRTVQDNKSDLQKYADEVTQIHNNYAEKVGGQYTGFNLNALGPEFYSFASAFGKAYREAAMALKNISVPSSLTQNHLELVNSYLSSAAAMEAISTMESDSAKAFSGVIVLNKNIDKESIILNKIAQILTSHGI